MYFVRLSETETTTIMLVHDETSISFVPTDEMNIDYQAYLAWVEAGNTAEEWTGI
jgi:hypothetical protein